MSVALEAINKRVQEESVVVTRILGESRKVIVGQTAVLERLLIGVLTGGHLLLEGVPGLAKTLAIKTLSQAVDTTFKRIQFTPDLLPSDVIGTMVYNPKTQTFSPKLGPIFANFVLADEINRAPAKVQSALLEAMQESQVTIGDETHPLKKPFLVLATQNPIDQEGTYPLPEAQVDRFLMKLKVTYPSKAEEKEIMTTASMGVQAQVNPVIGVRELLRAREVVKAVYVDEKIKDYVLNLVEATRFPEKAGVKSLKPLIQHGVSPRASIALLQAAKAHAFIKKRGFVTPEDIKAIGKDVLRHRIMPSFEAEAEEIDADAILDRLFSEIQVP